MKKLPKLHLAHFLTQKKENNTSISLKDQWGYSSNRRCFLLLINIRALVRLGSCPLFTIISSSSLSSRHGSESSNYTQTPSWTHHSFPKDLQKQNESAIIFRTKSNWTNTKQVKINISTFQTSKNETNSFVIVNNTHLSSSQLAYNFQFCFFWLFQICRPCSR